MQTDKYEYALSVHIVVKARDKKDAEKQLEKIIGAHEYELQGIVWTSNSDAK